MTGLIDLAGRRERGELANGGKSGSGVFAGLFGSGEVT